MLRYTIQMSLLAIVALYAWRKGGKPEKIVALILVGMPLIDFLYHSSFRAPLRMGNADLGHCMIDLAAFLGISIVALRANRLWTLVAASTQLLSLMSHLVRLLSLEIWDWSYAIMARAPSYLLILLLAIGTMLHSKRNDQERGS